tara:strand:- start:204 stop:476 length:273 start_codon:yes stop_codon:yes gene_type:complete
MEEPRIDRRVGFPSLYKESYEYWDDLKNLGYNYTDNLMKRTLSPYMLKNPNLAKFLTKYLQPIMVKYINTVKYVRIYFNFAVRKDYDKIN